MISIPWRLFTVYRTNKRYYLPYQLKNGNYSYALYDPNRNQYYRRVPSHIAKSSGAIAYCSTDPNALGGDYTEFPTLAAAKNAANQLNKNLDNASEP